MKKSKNPHISNLDPNGSLKKLDDMMYGRKLHPSTFHYKPSGYPCCNETFERSVKEALSEQEPKIREGEAYLKNSLNDLKKINKDEKRRKLAVRTWKQPKTTRPRSEAIKEFRELMQKIKIPNSKESYKKDVAKYGKKGADKIKKYPRATPADFDKLDEIIKRIGAMKRRVRKITRELEERRTMKSRKWVDIVDELFGRKGTKRRVEYDRFVANKHRTVARAKKSGNWPKKDEIYWHVRDQELHLVLDASNVLIWTEYGNKDISACAQMGPLSSDYVFIGKF